MIKCCFAALWLGVLLHCRAAVFRKNVIRDFFPGEQSSPLAQSASSQSRAKFTLPKYADSYSRQLIQLYSPETTSPARPRLGPEHLTSEPRRPAAEHRRRTKGVVRFSRVRHYVLEKLQNPIGLAASDPVSFSQEKIVPEEEEEEEIFLPSTTVFPAMTEAPVSIAVDLEEDEVEEEEESEEEASHGRALEATWHGNSYIPYRYRCQVSRNCRPGPLLPMVFPATGVAVSSPTSCNLLRWNYELPFSELPNLVFSFLATDMISGHTTPEKNRFLTALLNTGVNAFMHLNSSSSVFSIPADVDPVICKMKRSVEPAVKSLYHLLNIYTSRDQVPLLSLVRAAKSCLDNVADPFPLELLPCLDFSFGLEELLNLTHPRSLFGNPELCRRYLRFNVTKCLPARPHFCNEKQLTTLSTFAQRFYLCASAMPPRKPDASGKDVPFEEYPWMEEEVDVAFGRVSSSAPSCRHERPTKYFSIIMLLVFFSFFLACQERIKHAGI